MKDEDSSVKRILHEVGFIYITTTDVDALTVHCLDVLRIGHWSCAWIEEIQRRLVLVYGLDWIFWKDNGENRFS